MVSRFRSRPLPMPGIRPIHASCNHAIMQSCNQADLSLAAHRRGATKPIPGGRSSCVFPRRSSVSMRLMPMPRSQADRRCVCCRSRRQKVAPFSMNRACYLEERWSRQLSSIPRGNRTRVRIATRPSAWPSGPHSHLVVLSGVHGRIHSH